MHFKYFSVKEIQNFIRENNLAIHRKFGQNFLINAGVVDTIIANAGITAGDLVMEIGCGLGSLTHKLIETGASIIGFEIDNAFIRHLKNSFSDFKNFTLVEGDFLKKFDDVYANLDLTKYTRLVIAGNLPYYITTPILEKIFTGGIEYSRLIFMMQKEVAERIIAPEGSKTYGSLSIFCRFFTTPKIFARISPKSFYPAPNVESCLVSFEKNNTEYDLADRDLFFRVVRSLFISRRKQLKNNLAMSPLLGLNQTTAVRALKNADIAETIRGECLNIDEICRLANEIHKLKNLP